MPTGLCVPYLRVKDARASLDYFHRCLGFHREWEHQFEDGLPRCISIARGGLRFFLTEHTGDGSFGVCVYCYVQDADRLHAEFERSGALGLTAVKEAPWGRDFSVRDLDGNELRFGSARPDASKAA
jgi:uncharacterized glyoxalase superfamily protein PhnB